MIPARGILVLSLCAFALAFPRGASAQSFDTMAQPAETDEDCKAPRPPKDLDPFAYVRNGYREVLRITAIQSSLDEERCDCPFAEIDWQAVVDKSDNFKTSDNPKLPFDVLQLRRKADALAFEFGRKCGR